MQRKSIEYGQIVNLQNRRYSSNNQLNGKKLNYETLKNEMKYIGLNNNFIDDSNLDQLTKGQQMKSLLILKAQQQKKIDRPKTFNFRQQNKILQPFQFISEEDFQNLMQKSEQINNVNISDLFKIYKTKCQDNNIEYLPEQAVKFLERFKKNSINNKFFMNEENLGAHSSVILSKLIIKNKDIHQLFLQKNQFDHKSLIRIAKALTYNQSIISIDLSSNNLRPQDIQDFLDVIQDNKSLVKIDFKSMMGQFRNKIADTIAFKNYLQSNPCLQFLCVSRTNLNLKGLSQILQGINYNNSLVQLDISCNHLGFKCTQLIFKYLKKSNLQDLNLTENDITDQGINDLVHLYIEYPTFLKILNLSTNNIHSDGLKSLLSQLSTNESLERLFLNNNPFSEKEVFDCLGSFLKHNKNLKQLHLQHCRLNVNRIDQIVESLAINQTLTHLNLSENQLQNYGATQLSDGIKQNKCLKYLFIAKCKIGDEGGQKLANAWINNKTLKSIDFHSNSLQDEAALLIIKAILNNQNIIQINLNRNLISYKLQQEIYKFLKQNQYLKEKSRPRQIQEKVQDLKEFEQQKYNQFDIKQELEREQHRQENIIDLLKKKYQNENEEQNNILSQLDMDSCQLYSEEKKSIQYYIDKDKEFENELYELGNKKSEIETEQGQIYVQTRQLKEDREKLSKQYQENIMLQKNIIEEHLKLVKELQIQHDNMMTEQLSFKNQINRLKQKIDQAQEVKKPLPRGSMVKRRGSKI